MRGLGTENSPTRTAPQLFNKCIEEERIRNWSELETESMHKQNNLNIFNFLEKWVKVLGNTVFLKALVI